MTRCDNDGIPCIVQSIEFNCGMATVHMFDGTSVTTFLFSDWHNRMLCFRGLFSYASSSAINNVWLDLYRQVEGWANLKYKTKGLDNLFVDSEGNSYDS